MSIQIPATAQIQRPKAYFYFYSPLQTVFSSTTASDTTTVSKIPNTRVTYKSYSLTVPPGANMIRVVVYGYVSAPTGVFILNIDGVDVAQASTTSIYEVVVIDYIGPITPGSHTIKIDAYNTTESVYVYVSKVYIVTGIGVTSTTLSDLITFTVWYQLVRSGDIRYSPGVRLFIYGSRRTTAPARLEVGSNPITGRNQLEAGNDNNTTEVFLAIVTGSVTLQEGGEFTVSATLRGAVGATGDTIIITRIMARAQLRRESWDLGEVRINERGVVEYFARALLITVPGGATSTAHVISRGDIQGRRLAWIWISSGTDITVFNFRIAVVTPVHFSVAYCEEYLGETFLEWVQLVVWG